MWCGFCVVVEFAWVVRKSQWHKYSTSMQKKQSANWRVNDRRPPPPRERGRNAIDMYLKNYRCSWFFLGCLLGLCPRLLRRRQNNSRKPRKPFLVANKTPTSISPYNVPFRSSLMGFIVAKTEDGSLCIVFTVSGPEIKMLLGFLAEMSCMPDLRCSTFGAVWSVFRSNLPRPYDWWAKWLLTVICLCSVWMFIFNIYNISFCSVISFGWFDDGFGFWILERRYAITNKGNMLRDIYILFWKHWMV